MQAALVWFERKLAVSRWSDAAARVWTFSAIVLPSPLSIEGTLQSLGL